jgi:hypothetical protein
MDRFAVAADTYLKNRNGVFYLEMRVSSKLAGELRKTHIRWSLKTSSASEARRLRNTKLAEIEKLFLEAEQNIAIKKGDRTRIENMSEGQMELIVSNWVGKEQQRRHCLWPIFPSRGSNSFSDMPHTLKVRPTVSDVWHPAIWQATAYKA